MTARAGVAAVVLCGGRSERMGRPKALLPFRGSTLLEAVLAACGEVCGERIVVAAADGEAPPLPPGVRLVRDRVAGQGPLAGVAAGLAACGGAVALVVPCDAPLLRPAVADLLLSRLGDAEACRPVAGGLARPLPGVYRTALAPVAEALLAAGRRRVLDLADGRAVVDVPEEELRGVDPDLDSLRACNTPAEWESLG